MEFKDCIKFANENPVTHIATVEGDQPRVRGFFCGMLMSLAFIFTQVQ